MQAIIVALAVMIAGAPTTTPTPQASPLQAMEQRLKLLLRDVGRANEQSEVTLTPDQTGLKTIVTITVHPNVSQQLRGDLTKNVNEFIEIHQGDCRTNTASAFTNSRTLNPIRSGTSTTYVDVPFSTLTGHGNVITTRSPDGTILNCGAF